jgi:hypothetical protein
VAYIVLPGKYSTDLVLDIVLSGKQNPLPNRSQVAYRPVPEAIQHHTVPSRTCEPSPKPGGLAHIVPPGKIYRPLREMLGSALSSYPGTHTVLAGKLCRPARELTSSYGGRYIVLLGKIYRPTQEKLSSSLGNLAAFFAANVQFLLGRECERPVFVCVNCLLCFYGKRRILASSKGSSGGFPGRT